MTQVKQNSMIRQGGAILIVTMVFLVAISLLTVSSMQASNIGLFMAQNEESRIAAEQGAQALADAIFSDPSATPVIGGAGFTICTAGESGCDQFDLPVENFFEDMPPEVAASSLTAKKRGKAKTLPSHEPDPMATRETLELVRAYYKIEDAGIRKRLREMIAVLGADTGKGS